jgi:hypothetical protein
MEFVPLNWNGKPRESVPWRMVKDVFGNVINSVLCFISM